MDTETLAKKYGGVRTAVPTNDTASIAAKYGGVATPISTTAPSTPGLFERMGASATNEVVQGFTSAYQNAKKDFGSGTVAGGILGVSDIIGGAFTPLSAAFNAVTGNAVPKTVDAVGNAITNSLSPEGVAALNVVNDFYDRHPDLKRLTFEAGPNFINAAALGLGGEAKIGTPAEVIKGTAADIQAGAGKVSDLAGQAKGAVVTKLQDRYVTKAIDDWNRIGGDYVKTDRLLNQEQARISRPGVPESVQDTPTFLSEQGISPQSLIKNGKFDTTEIASKLTTESVKPFEQALTDQLKVVQQGQPLTQVSELGQWVTGNIDRIKNITEGDRVLMKNAWNREMMALQKKYPKGIALDEINVQKGNYWRNTKFDITRPLQSQVNYNIGEAFKNIIEAKAGDANVTELNGLLGNYYKAGKFLNGLNDRVPKLTLAQKVTRAVTKTAAFAVGESIFGISGGVGGYLFSKSLTNLLESASNPVRGMVLKTLEKTDPKAYKQAIEWLGKQEAERLTRLALPPARFTPMPAPKPVEPKVLSLPAEKISIKNPKTGKYERAYTSNPKKTK